MDIIWLMVDNTTGAAVSGASYYTDLVVRRYSDGYILDWNDNTFSINGGTLPTINYDEVDSNLIPGLYKKTVDISDWNDGTYHAISYYNSPSVSGTVMEEFYVADGNRYDDYLSNELSQLKNSVDDMNSKINTTPAATLLVQEYYNNEDADDNGLIYGVDFYITTDRPKMLDSLPKRGVPMTWDEYVASL